MQARNPLFNVLTPIEAMFLESRLRSAYSHAGAALFTTNRYDAYRVRSELLDIIDDLSPAS
jgi:hypothetical protein